MQNKFVSATTNILLQNLMAVTSVTSSSSCHSGVDSSVLLHIGANSNQPKIFSFSMANNCTRQTLKYRVWRVRLVIYKVVHHTFQLSECS